jgi:hypothetical protein
MATASIQNRQDLVRQGQRLEYFTIAYNSAEGLVSIVAGLVAGSVSLIGFGLDSLIEVASGSALLWRLHHDLNPSRRERVEQTTLKLVGWSSFDPGDGSNPTCIGGGSAFRHDHREKCIIKHIGVGTRSTNRNGWKGVP